MIKLRILRDGKVILDYLSGSNVTTKVLIRTGESESEKGRR